MRDVLALSTILLLASASAAAAADAASFEIPRIESITIDADDGDWGDRGLRIDAMTSTGGVLYDPKDLAARVRVGWDEQGLLLLVRVHDDVRDENAGDPIGRNDSIEVFVSDAPGSENRYQYSIAAGPPGGRPRGVIDDRRANRSSPAELKAEMAARSVDDNGRAGHVVEMRLPWANLGRQAKLGESFGLQVRVNDTDRSPRKSALWLPRTDSYRNPDAVQRIVLAERASPPVRVAAAAAYEPNLAGIDVNVCALPDLTDADIEIREGQRTLARGRLERQPHQSHQATATVRVPMPPPGESYASLQLLVDGQPAAAIDLDDPADVRARRLMSMPVVFNPANVFNGAEFPRGDFENPLAAQQAIGPYHVRATYYDAGYNVVTAATKPGRYGAVLEFVPNDGGRVLRRFRTIYRLPDGVDLWRSGIRARLENPQALGLDPAAVDFAGEQWGLYTGELLNDAIRRDSRLPALMAYLSNAATTSPAQAWRRNRDAFAEDRQWWVGLKRKLNGWDQRWSEPFIAPRPTPGEGAPQLRPGSPAEAGLSKEGVEKIDAVCKQWAADSDQGFAVCIARNGVIVLHKAYGQRDGRAMTLDDKSYIASITKVFSGVAMMMLIDQGVIGMNDPADKYLPALAAAKVDRPATIHHLYTHTAGLWDHWGDDLHDFDEIVGEHYPRLPVGGSFRYNGASQALGGKIIEAVTGEALPAFYLKHLLEPLGMQRTDIGGSGTGAETTALDLATFGQMLLNGGAYGPMRFLRPESIEKMMPRSLDDLTSRPSGQEWGFGLTYHDEDGPLGPNVIGHGAASNSLFMISREKQLVLVMTRNAAGANYGKYEEPFLAAVNEAIAAFDAK